MVRTWSARYRNRAGPQIKDFSGFMQALWQSDRSPLPHRTGSAPVQVAKLRFASSWAMCRKDWRTIVSNTVKNLVFGPTTLVAAGCSFYTTPAS